ncbi:hypothetical protein ACJMK2_041793 [Sinanodonta woodiana]|uniref:G-protein coupled receptors family 1 profile domain-containing protein n=1 Tax=Sinanodonta woodiana TaxID=1069815 RepID=A0ABD3W6N9_SINWO
MDHTDSFKQAETHKQNDTNISCSGESCITREQWLHDVLLFIYPSYYEWIFIILYFVVFVLGLVGNILVCYSVCQSKHLRTVTNYFLVNLAIADFFVILICLPPSVVHTIAESWFLGLTMCKLVQYLQHVSVFVSVLTLAAISVERYMAICHPLTFKGTKFKTRLALIIIWIISLSAAVPELHIMVLLHDDVIPASLNPLLSSCIPGDANMELQYQITITVAFYLFPLSVSAFAYIKIARCLWSSGEMVNLNMRGNSAINQLRARQRTAKMLIVVVIVFCLCYLPVYSLNIFRYMGLMRQIQNDDILVVLTLTAHWLCYFNSAINPVIYNFMSGKFRSQFKAACSKCFRARQPGSREENLCDDFLAHKRSTYKSFKMRLLRRSSNHPINGQTGQTSMNHTILTAV